MEQIEIRLEPRSRGFHLITSEIEAALNSLQGSGIVHLFLQHTSAGICVNENADYTVRTDMEKWFDRHVKENEPYYEHTFEGPDDMPAHIKAVLMGTELSIPFTEGRLNLGTWQGIYLGEFRNQATSRKILATIMR